MNAFTECGFSTCAFERAEYQLALNVFAVYLFRGGFMIIFDIKRYRNRADTLNTNVKLRSIAAKRSATE